MNCSYQVTFPDSDMEFPLEFSTFVEISDGGYERGYAQGHQDGYDQGYGTGQQIGYDQGYSAGYADGETLYAKELEYIESTGSQYINTGYVPSSRVRVVLDAYIEQNVTGFLFGTRAGLNTQTYALLVHSETQRFRFDLYDRSFLIPVFFGRLAVDCNRNICTINDKVITGMDVDNWYETPFYLFGINNAGEPGYLYPYRLYSCQIYDNGNMVRDYIPVLDKQNVPCLFDRVQKQLCHNDGTGAFLYPGEDGP